MLGLPCNGQKYPSIKDFDGDVLNEVSLNKKADRFLLMMKGDVSNHAMDRKRRRNKRI